MASVKTLPLAVLDTPEGSARTIGLRPVTSSNPRAPRYEIVALNDQRRWVIVGALFELSSNSTGESFYQGKIDDPSMAQPLYIAAFPREDGTMAIAWQRPRRRNTQLGSAEYGECDMFPADDTGGDRVQEQAGAGCNDDGLGESTATPPAKCGRVGAKDRATHDGALPPLVNA